ncbi:hypothetical protein L226DRAFT_538955 [Lentinus tigrinus ALCF2SS1-7]|uniref:uncharacterized protein n=1 Tax=Lentinus tigrinus ALCF2SS1-7 TaxID=1328758 RepID=UPI001165FB28|nr:hypothetical protein L226DRAFT_538955 [Lentinus tigrinus ALCF2SS1-7]
MKKKRCVCAPRFFSSSIQCTWPQVVRTLALPQRTRDARREMRSEKGRRREAMELTRSTHTLRRTGTWHLEGPPRIVTWMHPPFDRSGAGSLASDHPLFTRAI